MKSKNMLVPTIIMACLASVLFFIALQKADSSHIIGLKNAFSLFIRVLPILVFAFIVAGFMEILLPTEFIIKFMGGESGIKGIFWGCVFGGITPGGPGVSLTIGLGLFKAGAGIGACVSYLTGWALWSVSRIPMEIGILGPKLTLIRYVSTFILPPIAGLLAYWIFEK